MPVSAGTAFVDLRPRLSPGFQAATAGLVAPTTTAAMVASGKRLTKGLTVPILAAGAGLVALGKNFEEAEATIRVSTGATGEVLEDLVDSFKTVAVDLPGSFDDAATAIANLNSRTGATGEVLETLASKSLKLAKITGEDLGEIIASTTRVFGDWDISIEDGADTLDLLFRVLQATGVPVTDLARKLVQFGAPLRQLGFDFDVAAALFGKFEKEGVNAELVMGSLRIALGKMARAGEPLEETFRRTVAEIAALEDASKAAALAGDLFGARAGPDMGAAIREGRFEVDELVASLANSSETIDQAEADSRTLGNQFAVLSRKLGIKLLPLAEALTEVLIDALPAISAIVDIIGFAVDIFGALPGPVLSVIVGVVGLLAVLGPLLVIGAKLIPLIKIVGVVIGFLASPIGLAIAAVALLAFIIVKNWDTIKAATATVFGAIGSVISITFETVKSVIGGALDFLTGLWQNWIGPAVLLGHFEAIGSFISDTWATVKEAFQAAWEFIKEIMGKIADAVTGAIDRMLGPLDEVAGAIGGIVSGGASLLGKLPGLAHGGTVTAGGLFRVGEEGEETLFLPTGAAVAPLPLDQLAAGGGDRMGDITIINPTPEPASITIPRALRRQGLLAGRT